MRPSLAGEAQAPSSHVIILGERITAARLASDFSQLGFVPHIQVEQGPPISDPIVPGSINGLRKALQTCLEQLQQGEYDYCCIHPGLSPWADRPEFPLVVQELGIDPVSVGPKTLNLFSDKLTFMSQAEKLGVPNLVLSFDPIQGVREVERVLDRMSSTAKKKTKSFPIVLKPVRGGSTAGVKVIRTREEIDRELPLWIEGLRLHYGEAIFFAEYHVEGARLIQLPFARFASGNIEFFPMVDHSLQFGNRSMLEFCPPVSIDAAVVPNLQAWTQVIAESCSFVGIGSVGYLVDGPRAFLIGGTARLDSRYALWEKVAGTSAAAWQLATLEGWNGKSPLRRQAPQWVSGISLSLWAEDPILGIPCPGVAIEAVAKPRADAPETITEVELAISPGEEVGPETSGWLGEIRVGASSRIHALKVAEEALSSVWIAGTLQTNERFLAELLTHPWIHEGVFHAGFVEEEFVPRLKPPDTVSAIAVAACAEIAPDLDEKKKQRWAVADRWVEHDSGVLVWKGKAERKIGPTGAGLCGWIELPEKVQEGQGFSRVAAFPVSIDRWNVRVGSWLLVVRRIDQTRQRASVRPVLSLVSGKIHAIRYREGTHVAAHEPLVVVESLKQLVPHALPREVRLVRWAVKAEEHVLVGQVLGEFEFPTTLS